MTRFKFAFVFLLMAVAVKAQDPMKYIDSCYKQALASKTDSGFISNMMAASSGAFEFDRGRCINYLTRAMVRAEESRNAKLICDAKLFAASMYSSRFNLTANMDTAMMFAKKALETATLNNLPVQQGWSHIVLARINRTKDRLDDAMQHSQSALMLANTQSDDSLLVHAHIGLANSLNEKSQKLDAFRNYMLAMDIADRSDRSPLLISSYWKISDFYSSIKQHEKSKDYLYKILNIHRRKKGELYEIVPVYAAIAKRNIEAKQYDIASAYIDTALKMCDDANKPMVKLNLLDPLFQLHFSSNNAQKIFTLLEEKKDMIDLIKSIGFTAPIDFLIGAAYSETNRLDSAEYYYKRAAPFYENQSANDFRQLFLKAYGELYKRKADYPQSIVYYQRVYDFAKETGNLEMQKDIAQELDSIFQRTGNYEKAWQYAGIYSKINDSLRQLSQEKDLIGVEVENENKRKEREAVREKEKQNRRYNIQYMGITIAIAAIFLLLAVVGAFKLSKTMIKVIGFFAFILLFEFIILLADNQIHHWTHGEPWKVLGIKIGLIAVLLPLHHWLEHKVIHYLMHKDLLSGGKFPFLKKKVVLESNK